MISAQSGGPLLTHYRESTEIENQSWAICQDENNVMLFANIRGLLTFDGQSWNTISLPVIPYSLKFNKTQRRVYVGGDNDYGFLRKDEKGFYNFVSLKSDTSRTGIISRIVFTDSTVWFYGEKTILRHDLGTGKLQVRLAQKGNNPFTGMFVTPKNVFINVYSKGLYRLESDTLFPIVTGYLTEKKEILFGLPYDKKMVVVGEDDGTLSLFDGIKYYPYQVQDNGYLSGNSLADGIVISDSLYAFSTLDGGAMVVERLTGKVRFSINYLNGLPDDEIFAIGSDHNSGLWLSHQYGLTRVELSLPVANLGIYPGLKGNLVSPLWYGNELYVAASDGVFYLSEIRNYAETQVIVKKGQEGNDQNAITGTDLQEGRKTRRSIFSRIFGKKPAQEQQDAVSPGEQGKNQYIQKTVSRLKSIEYGYRKVEGISEKCRQMLPAPDGILVSTVKGIYLVSGHKARLIASGRNINSVCKVPDDGRYYVASSDGYFYLLNGVQGWTASALQKGFNQPLYSIACAGKGILWAGGDDFAVRLTPGTDPGYHIYPIKSDYPQHCRVCYANDTLFAFNESGVLFYDQGKDALVPYTKVSLANGQRLEYIDTHSAGVYFRQETGWIYLGSRNSVSGNDLAILKIFDNIASISTDDKDMWVVTADNQVYRIAREKAGKMKHNLELFVRSIQDDKGLFFNISKIEFERGDNNVYFDIVAPGYQKRNSILYQYTVDGMMDDWSKWSSHSTINLMLPHGTYSLRVRAKDIWGNITEPRQITFTIKTPFIQTTFFYILVLALGLVAVVIIVRFRERHLQHENHILEEKVRERTAEIEAQKQEITSSIEYAGRIQQAMLPMEEVFKNAFSEHFIMFRPRDIVSGDFYWIGEDSKHYFFTVADCTGHGVPGAFMSTLGMSTLNEIITNKSDLHANTVLNLLRIKIKTSLHQTGKEGEAADGMDIAFCILHKDKKILEYAGAYNPLFICQGGEVKEYKADRMPIGIYVGEKESFTNYEINVSKGDVLYLFSDGMPDQFGGPGSSKYKKSSLKKLFSTIFDKPLGEQKVIIENEFERWKGNGAQIDDVTVVGVRI